MFAAALRSAVAPLTSLRVLPSKDVAPERSSTTPSTSKTVRSTRTSDGNARAAPETSTRPDRIHSTAPTGRPPVPSVLRNVPVTHRRFGAAITPPPSTDNVEYRPSPDFSVPRSSYIRWSDPSSALLPAPEAVTRTARHRKSPSEGSTISVTAPRSITPPSIASIRIREL